MKNDAFSAVLGGDQAGRCHQAGASPGVAGAATWRLLLWFSFGLVVSACSGGAQIGEAILPATLGEDQEILYYRGPDVAPGQRGPVYLAVGKNQSRAFDRAADVAQTGLVVGGVKAVSGDVSGVMTNRDNISGATDQLGITEGATTERLQIETEGANEAARIAIEAEAAGVAP